MKTKDFFRLIIKLLGLYALIVSLFSVFPTYIPLLFNIGKRSSDWLPFLWVILVVGLLALLFFSLTFRPDFLIEKLKLDKGFESDEINFQNLNAKGILHVGIILVGGIMFIRSLPSFISGSYQAIKSAVATSEDVRMTAGFDTDDQIWLVINFLNLLISYLLLTNYQFVSRILLPKEEQ